MKDCRDQLSHILGGFDDHKFATAIVTSGDSTVQTSLRVTIANRGGVWSIRISPIRRSFEPRPINDVGLDEAVALITRALLARLRTESPTFDVVSRGLMDEVNQLNAQNLDNSTYAAWETVLKLAKPVDALLQATGSESADDLSTALNRVRQLQLDYRQLAADFREIGDTASVELVRDHLLDLGTTTAALGAGATLIDARLSKQKDDRSRNQSSRLTTLAFILVLPTLYVTALPLLMPQGNQDFSIRLAIVTVGSLVSALVGWFLSMLVVSEWRSLDGE